MKTKNSKTIIRSESLFTKQFDLLKMEITLINSAIRSYDDIMKNIKNWAIVSWTASIWFTISNPTLQSFAWVTIFIPSTFWVVDGTFRRIQRSFIVRINEIAAYINSPAFLTNACENSTMQFELMRMRSKGGPKTSWFAVMKFRTVSILYILMILGSLLVYFLFKLSINK